jgi:hypothetical protein
VASNPQPGQKLAFDISGDGLLKSQDEEASNPGAAASDSRPGGGLGVPIDAPDPLEKSAGGGGLSYRVIILAGLGIVLVIGAVYTAQRSKASSPVVAGANGGHSNRLMDALKEELFQLEVEHKQGQISDEEYGKTKAALDQTLTRAIKRNL